MNYDYTRDALYFPEKLEVFLDREAMEPFPVGGDGFSARRAWWLANFSHLAYYDPEPIAERLGAIRMEPVGFFANGGTAGYLAADDRFAVLAFRGTEPDDLDDLRQDLRLLPRKLASGVAVHRGFLEALDFVWDEVERLLEATAKRGVPVCYTGHSLGAAVATLAAARRPPAALYTYGSPRVGGPDLARHMAAIEIQRCVNCTDIVTTLPPPHVEHYRHLGEVRFFAHSGDLHVDPSRWAMLRARAAGQVAYRLATSWYLPGKVKARGFTDHSIVNYTEAARRVVARQRT